MSLDSYKNGCAMRTRACVCVHGFFNIWCSFLAYVCHEIYQFSVPTSKSRSKDSGLLLDDDSTTSLATFDEKVLILSISTGSSLFLLFCSLSTSICGNMPVVIQKLPVRSSSAFAGGCRGSQQLLHTTSAIIMVCPPGSPLTLRSCPSSHTLSRFSSCPPEQLFFLSFAPPGNRGSLS